jgi:hypothetical protein
VQRRLAEAVADDLVSAYLAGSSIDWLAAELSVQRATITQPPRPSQYRAPEERPEDD